MYKFFALYKKPEDVPAFLDPYFLIAEMQFETKEDFDTAMSSDENRATGKDAMQFAKGLITALIAESEGD